MKNSCPSCDVEMHSTAVLCVNCGYDIRTGQRLTSSRQIEPSHPHMSNANPIAITAIDASPPHFSGVRYVLSFFSLRGRVTRRYWWIVHLVFAAMECVFAILDSKDVALEDFEEFLLVPVLLFLWVIYVTHVKRWHDLDKSGWWFLVNNIPVFGWLYSIIELGFTPGTVGPNDYRDA